MVRVAVADDHALVLEGLAKILGDESGIEVVGTCSSGGELIEVLETQPPVDVVVLDLVMPGRSGLDVLAEITRRWPSTAVLVVSAHHRAELAVQCIRGGARGFASKGLSPREFTAAVRAVAHGEMYLTPSVMLEVVDALANNDGRAPHERLSSREMDVFLRLATGSSVIAIGEELHLSPKTISTYRRRLLEKLQLTTNAELTRYALEHQLFELVP